MSRQSSEELENKILAKHKKRDKRKHPTMKISGAKVKDLQRIIKNK